MQAYRHETPPIEAPRGLRALGARARRLLPGAAGAFWIGYFAGVALLAWTVG